MNVCADRYWDGGIEIWMNEWMKRGQGDMSWGSRGGADDNKRGWIDDG